MITLTREQVASLFVEGNDWGRCLVGVPKNAKLVGITHDRKKVSVYFHVPGGPKRAVPGKAVWERQKSLSLHTKELG